MNTENRVSPQAPEIEEAIIGACLIEQRAIPLIADKLRPEMFYVLRHQLIYAAILAMYHAGMKIDILTVKEELSHRGKLEEAGGAFGITQLSSKVATSAHLEYHAQIVHEKYLRREMTLGFNKLLACSLDETMDIDDSLMDAHNLLDRLEGEFGHNNHMRDMDELMTATMTEAEGRIANNINGVTGIPTGLADLDRMTSGLQNGELVVIAARPGVGKTAFALHLARNAAMAGHAVAVYSLEMQGERLADRWLTAASEVSARHWRGARWQYGGRPPPWAVGNRQPARACRGTHGSRRPQTSADTRRRQHLGQHGTRTIQRATAAKPTCVRRDHYRLPATLRHDNRPKQPQPRTGSGTSHPQSEVAGQRAKRTGGTA